MNDAKKNNYIGELITNDVNSLAHYGVPGQKRGQHDESRRWQNHAVYARGNPRYSDKNKKRQAEAKVLDPKSKEDRKTAREMMKNLRATGNLPEYTSLVGKITSDAIDTSGKSFAARQKAKEQYKNGEITKEEFKRLAKEQGFTIRDQMGKFDNVQDASYDLSRRRYANNQWSAYTGENDAFTDLGLNIGWSKPRQALNNFSYYVHNPEKCNTKLDKFVQNARNSKVYRALMLDYGRKADRNYYINAYNRVMDKAFNEYGLTPGRRLTS